MMKRTPAFTLAFSILAFLGGLAREASAQTPAATFEELRTTLKLNEKEPVEITGADGVRFKARVTSLTDGEISIVRNGMSQRLTETDIRQIRQARPDGVGNGALIGLAGGVGAALVAVRAACGPNDSECAAIASLVFVPSFAGGGVGLGVLADALIKKHDTVFERPANAAWRNLRIAPVVGKKTAGLSVSFGF